MAAIFADAMVEKVTMEESCAEVGEMAMEVGGARDADGAGKEEEEEEEEMGVPEEEDSTSEFGSIFGSTLIPVSHFICFWKFDVYCIE